MKRILVGAAVVVMSACGGGVDAPYAEAAPADLSALSLEVSGDAAEGAALTALGGVQRQGLTGGPDGLVLARERVKALNGAVRQLVTRVAELVVQNGAPAVGDARVYGPQVKNGAAYRLTVKRVATGQFGWKLEAKAEAAPDTDYQPVAGGTLTKGLLPHRGRGTAGMDLDTWRTIDPTVLAAGKVFCGFAHVGDSKTLAYGLKGFTPDPATVEAISAHFVGHRVMPSKATAVRVAGRFNLQDSPTAAQELVRARVRFTPGVGGVAALLATEGDVPAGKMWVGRACWDAVEQEGFAIVRECALGADPATATCTVLVTRGQLSNCRLPELPLPPQDADDATLEAEAPASDVAAPGTMP